MFLSLNSMHSNQIPNTHTNQNQLPNMVVSGAGGNSDWAKQLKQFDETMAGVKGLVDSGVAKLPCLFVHPPEILKNDSVKLDLPTIDFLGLNTTTASRRQQVVEEIRQAAQNWGFFKIINHGIPSEMLDAVLTAVQQFHEQETTKKAPLYSTDSRRRVRFSSNGSALTENDRACWRDMLTCVYTDDHLDPNEIPTVCRKEIQEYVKRMIELRETMAELLSEALGLDRHHLSDMECMKSQALACLYYPPCPEPDKTLGTPKHSDTTFLTLLLQDSVGGLQVLHDDRWVDVVPVPGALIANIGDLLQIISNDRFVSVEHRVIAQEVGPRVSVACFFTPSIKGIGKKFGPIKELVTEEEPAVYREVLFREYCEYYKIKGQDVSALPHFRV